MSSTGRGESKPSGPGMDYSEIVQLQSGAIALHPSQRGKMPTKNIAASSQVQSTGPSKPSSQMDAVMRIMTGQGERTVAQKLADSNRPTWEQYKKDNEDKLDIVGQDQKKMEAYRKELDADRERRLKKGLNHGAKFRNSDESDDGSRSHRKSSKKYRKDRKKHSSKHRKKERKRRKRKYDSDSNSDEYSSDDDSSSRRKKKRSKKHKKKSSVKDIDDDKYRLSSFFTKRSGDSD